MSNDKVARPKPTKQQKRFFLALNDRLMKLYDEEGEYFWKEHPWLEDPTLKPEIIEKPEWEAEKAVLKKKILKVHDEIDKLYREMYPPQLYPEMHTDKYTEQPSLLGEESKFIEKPKAKTVEDMSEREIKKALGSIPANTSVGQKILEEYNRRVRG